MRQAILLLLPLLAACGQGDGNDAAPAASNERVQTADLTGLYEAGGESEAQGRMCMIADPSGGASFGIVSDAPEGGSCGGAGKAVREGARLRLTMAGDEQCVIDAQIDGTKVTFPAAVPEGCSYYCGPGATLADQSFEKTGGTPDDAMRAIDLAGEPLCG